MKLSTKKKKPIFEDLDTIIIGGGEGNWDLSEHIILREAQQLIQEQKKHVTLTEYFKNCLQKYNWK